MMALLERFGLPVWVLPLAGFVIGLVGAAMVTRWYYRAEIAGILADDAAAAVKATEAARIQDDKFTQLARDSERQHNDYIAKIQTLSDQLSGYVAAHGLHIKAHCGPVSKDAAAPGSSADGTTDIRLPDEISRDLLNLARDADQCAAYARTAHDWAVKVGR